MPRLDEQALRRPEFRDGPRVALADGQEWTFPRPRISIRPLRNRETGRIEVGGGPTFGALFQSCLDAYVEADAEDTDRLLSLQFEMACLLLLQNYNLTDDDLATLLETDLEDEGSRAMWEAILPVLMGRVPKPSPDGSATP